MKNIFTILNLLVFMTSAIGQTIEKLDERNGFKTLKFGTTLDKFKNELEYKGTGKAHDTNIFIYKGNNSELKKVFDTEFDILYLSFDFDELLTILSSKLVGIYLVKTYSGGYDSDWFKRCLDTHIDILTKFVSIIGKYHFSVLDEYGQHCGGKWIGKKVLLRVYYKYYGVEAGKAELTVEFESVDFLKGRLEKGF